MRNVSRGGIEGGCATVVGVGVAVAAAVVVGVAVWVAVGVGVGVTVLAHPVIKNDTAIRTTSECIHILDLKIFIKTPIFTYIFGLSISCLQMVTAK
jgi:hypothetical protein